jgi:hypothetical protein
MFRRRAAGASIAIERRSARSTCKRRPQALEGAEVDCARCFQIWRWEFRVVYPGSKTLFPPRIFWRGKRAANIAGCDSRVCGVQLRQRPCQILNGEFSVLPICDRFFGSEAIEIDRHIHIRASQSTHEFRETLPPVRAQDRAAPILLRRRTIVRPRMNLEPPSALGPPVSEKLPRPPAFEIPAAPDAHFLHMGQFERAIHPASAGPARRAHVPVRMIIEGNEHERIAQPPHPERAQVMKITGTVNKERCEPPFVFTIKLFDQPRGRGEAKSRPPGSGIHGPNREGIGGPGVVEVEMNRAGQGSNLAGERAKATAHFH